MSSEHSTVLFQVPARGVRRRELQGFARQIQTEVAQGNPFTCLVTSDQDLQQWNRRFRGKDYATDVLSFPRESDGKELGEIAISFDRAKAQAAVYGHDASQELRILMLHGVLHLLGFDHETDGGEMARAERRWRRYFALPTGLIERVQS